MKNKAYYPFAVAMAAIIGVSAAEVTDAHKAFFADLQKEKGTITWSV